MPTLFLGLGPRGDVSREQLMKKIDAVAPVVDLRYRSTCAYCDVESKEVGDLLIRNLHETFIGQTKLSVSWALSDVEQQRRHTMQAAKRAEARITSAVEVTEKRRERRRKDTT